MLEKQENFARIVKDHLSYNIGYFTNFERLTQVSDLIEKYCVNKGKVLNLASGPAMTDIFLESQGYDRIIAIDINKDFNPIYRKCNEQKILTRTNFILGSVNNMPFKKKQMFDLILMHDCLDVKELDLYKILGEAKNLLKKDGFLLFDIWDKKVLNTFKPVYKLLYPKHLSRKHYDLQKVKESLALNGFVLEEISPTTKRKSKRHDWKKYQWIPCFIIWKVLHLSNTVYIVARKT